MGDGVHAAVASSSSSEATIHAIEPLETTASGLDGTDGEADSLTEHDDDLEADDDGDDAPTPRFMQDEGAWKHWRWVPYPARRFATAVVRWSRGPADARAFAIKPFFPAVQRAPSPCSSASSTSSSSASAARAGCGAASSSSPTWASGP